LNGSLFGVSYIAVEKRYPLYFRAFQYSFNTSTNQTIGQIDETVAFGRPLPLNITLKLMYAITGLMLSPQAAGNVPFSKNLVFL
jgi:hypothetical protein